MQRQRVTENDDKYKDENVKIPTVLVAEAAGLRIIWLRSKRSITMQCLTMWSLDKKY